MSVLATIGIVIAVIVGGAIVLAVLGAILAFIASAWSH
jgi:hypothetical protein